MSTLLVIDDDRSIPFMIERALQGSGIEVLSAKTVQEGLELLEKQPTSCSWTSCCRKFRLGSGAEIQARDPKLPIIFITAGGTSDTTIEAMKLGAYDYLLKPLDLPKLKDLVDRALEIRRLMQVRVDLPTNDLRIAADLRRRPDHRSQPGDVRGVQSDRPRGSAERDDADRG